MREEVGCYFTWGTHCGWAAQNLGAMAPHQHPVPSSYKDCGHSSAQHEHLGTDPTPQHRKAAAEAAPTNMALRPEGAPPARRERRRFPRDGAAAGRRCRAPQRGVRNGARDEKSRMRGAGYGGRGTKCGRPGRGRRAWRRSRLPGGERRRRCRSRWSRSAKRWRLAPEGSAGRPVQLRTGRRPAQGTITSGVCRLTASSSACPRGKYQNIPSVLPSSLWGRVSSGTAGTELQSSPASRHGRSAGRAARGAAASGRGWRGNHIYFKSNNSSVGLLAAKVSNQSKRFPIKFLEKLDRECHANKTRPVLSTPQWWGWPWYQGSCNLATHTHILQGIWRLADTPF